MRGPGRLTSLQWRILEQLAGIDPPFTLVGGAALAGFHLGHRETRDLDLFWRERAQLGDEPAHVIARLQEIGLRVTVLQRAPAFVRLRVAGENETVVVDLVAEPSLAVRADEKHMLGSASIRVASPHDVFVAKLCALLGRSELRDLVDVRSLLDSGADLAVAVVDAPSVDTGFSALTLAWVLRGLPIARLGQLTGTSAEESDELATFRDELVEQLLALAKPKPSA